MREYVDNSIKIMIKENIFSDEFIHGYISACFTLEAIDKKRYDILEGLLIKSPVRAGNK